MKKLNVMITGVGGGGVGEQIFKCLKLSEYDYGIIGCDMSRTSKGLKLADASYLVPAASDPKYIDHIVKICRKHDVKVLFHGSEAELKVFSRYREVLQDQGIYVPLNPRELIDTCMDKNKTMEFLSENGFAIQKFWEIRNEDEAEQVDIFPVVLKPSVGGGGSANTFIAQDREELYTFTRYLLHVYDQFLVQEYIGNVNHEYTVGVLHGSDGGYINSIAVKKSILSGLSNKIKIQNRTERKELGDMLAISSGISQGEIGRFEEVTAPSREIARALGATAAINVQGRIHNGRMYVFEINPRISGTSSLRALVGYNEPDLLIRERVLGESIERDFAYESGYITRGLDETFISSEFMDQLGTVE